MLRRVSRVSRLDLGDFSNPANQVGVKVAGSICTKTAARASPSNRSDGEVACSSAVVSPGLSQIPDLPGTGEGRFSASPADKKSRGPSL